MRTFPSLQVAVHTLFRSTLRGEDHPQPAFLMRPVQTGCFTEGVRKEGVQRRPDVTYGWKGRRKPSSVTPCLICLYGFKGHSIRHSPDTLHVYSIYYALHCFTFGWSLKGMGLALELAIPHISRIQHTTQTQHHLHQRTITKHHVLGSLLRYRYRHLLV